MDLSFEFQYVLYLWEFPRCIGDDVYFTIYCFSKLFIAPIINILNHKRPVSLILECLLLPMMEFASSVFTFHRLLKFQLWSSVQAARLCHNFSCLHGFKNPLSRRFFLCSFTFFYTPLWFHDLGCELDYILTDDILPSHKVPCPWPHIPYLFFIFFTSHILWLVDGWINHLCVFWGQE